MALSHRDKLAFDENKGRRSRDRDKLDFQLHGGRNNA